MCSIDVDTLAHSQFKSLPSHLVHIFNICNQMLFMSEYCSHSLVQNYVILKKAHTKKGIEWQHCWHYFAPV